MRLAVLKLHPHAVQMNWMKKINSVLVKRALLQGNV